MNDKVHVFIDTNILVYAHDADAGAKHKAALKLVASLWDLPYPPAISSQVLQELYVTLLKKGATASECRKIVSIYLDWEIISHDTRLFLSALSLRERFKLSLWDSLILAAAERAKALIVWSEDFQAGQHFGSLLIENPIG